MEGIDLYSGPAAGARVRPLLKINRMRTLFRAAVFLFLGLAFAFAVGTVQAEGELPPPDETSTETLPVPEDLSSLAEPQAPADCPPSDELLDPDRLQEDPAAQDCDGEPGCEDPAAAQAPADPEEAPAGCETPDTSDPVESALDDQVPLETQAEADPQFCSEGFSPGDADCSESRTTIQEAVDDASRAGTIFLELSQSFDQALQIEGIEFDLTLSGGWIMATAERTGTSTINGPVTIKDSSGTITFEHILFGPDALITILNSSSVSIMGTAGKDSVRISLQGTGPTEVDLEGGDDDDSLSIEGTLGDDEFNVAEDTVSSGSKVVRFTGFENVTLKGGSGADTLVGPDADMTWELTGQNKGQVLGIEFESIENLRGGAGDDTFKFTTGAELSGWIDGGGGSNTLDYSLFGALVTVNLNSEAVKIDSLVYQPLTATAVTGGILNILNVTGGSGNDVLIGSGFGGVFNGGGGTDTILDDEPQLLVGALKVFLAEFQQKLFEEVFGNTIPLVGDALSQDCGPDNDVCPGAWLSQTILGAIEDHFDNLLVVDFASFQAQLLSALHTVASLAVLSVVWTDPTFKIIAAEQKTHQIPFGTGLSGLDLAINGDQLVDLKIQWNLTLTFGIDAITGFYVVRGPPDVTEMTIAVEAEFVDQDPHLGSVGLFQAAIRDGVNSNYSHFNGEYTVTFSGGVDPIHGIEIYNLPIDGRLTSTISQIYLTIEKAAFALDEITLDLPEDVPSHINIAIKAEFSATWGFNNADTSVSHGSFGDVPVVKFENISLDPGPFFNQILRPFIESIQQVTRPLQPIIDILQAPIPILSDFGLLPGTLLELLGASDSVVAAISLINTINGITFGTGKCSGDASACELWIPIGDGFEVSDPRLHEAKIPVPEPIFGDWRPTWEAESEKYGFTMSGDVFGDNSFFSLPVLEDPNEVYGLLLGIHARLFTVNIPEIGLSYELPDDLKACLWRTLCIKFYGEVGITAGPMQFGYDTYGIKRFIDNGASDYLLLADGFYIADLCDDGNEVNYCERDVEGNVIGERVPLIELHFDVGVAVSIGVDIKILSVEAGVAGGVEGSIRFNLHDGKIGDLDEELDGKIRGSEILWNASFGWTCIFDIAGEIEAYLKVYVKVQSDFGLFKITWYSNSWDLARFTLVEFCQSCEGEPPPLAHMDGDTLILHTGRHAKGSAYDLTGLSAYSIDEYFTVTHIGGTWGDEKVSVSAYGYSQEFSGVKKIIAYGDAGNDKITINTGVLSDAKLYGGEGDDTLVYKGSGEAWLYGDCEETKIDCKTGNDTLVGGSGTNYLHGGDEEALDPVWIEPDPDRRIGIFDEVSGTWLGYFETQFNDQLYGGPGTNWMHAGSGNDKLFGGPGINYLYGEEGNDVLSAGKGENYMYGGTGNDTFIWAGGGGFTQICGNNELDKKNVCEKPTDDDKQYKDELFINLKLTTSQMDVGAQGEVGQIAFNAADQPLVTFQDINELTINTGTGAMITIGDVHSTSLKRINVHTGQGSGAHEDLITMYGSASADNILVDTQPMDDSGALQSVHVGFCADTGSFCPTDPLTGRINYSLELFVTGTSTAENDWLVVNGGAGDDTFQVRPGPAYKVSELVYLEVNGGEDFDTVLGLDTPNIWTLSHTNFGDLNAEFRIASIEKIVGGKDHDTLIGPAFASTFRMVSDFDGILNDSLYYFSIETLVGASDADTLIGSDTFNFWLLMQVNDGELFRFAGPEGLLALMDDLQAAGAFRNNGAHKSLRHRLELAIQAFASGRTDQAAMQMWMFVLKLDETAARGHAFLPGGSTVRACQLLAACRVGGTLVYKSFENLTGGSGEDMFVFADGMGVSGVIDGGAGIDWLNYAFYTTPIRAGYHQGYATGTGGIRNIERAVGRNPHMGRALAGNQSTTTNSFLLTQGDASEFMDFFEDEPAALLPAPPASVPAGSKKRAS